MPYIYKNRDLIAAFADYVAVVAVSRPGPIRCPSCGSKILLDSHPEHLRLQHSEYCPAYILNDDEEE
jgi:hypothetical protein